MTKFKIKETYLLMLIVIGLVSLGIYTTYALFTASTTINDVVGISTSLDVGKGLTEYEIVTVNPSETKLIELNIVNSYSSTIYYGAWYQIIKGNSSDIDIGIYTEKNSNSSSGTLASKGSINLLAGVTNNGDTTITVYIGAKGSLTNELNLGDNKVLLPSGFSDTLLVTDEVLEKHKEIKEESITVNETFSYNGEVQNITLGKGTYKLEVWGAQGGSYSTTYTGGKGGYSYGTLTLNEETNLFVYVGGQGSAHSTTIGGISAGGFNGGGSAKTIGYGDITSYVTGGGGASDIRIGQDSLYARVIVAGGGSGSSNNNSGYYGGGSTTGYGVSGYGATSTSAGTNGSFGTGANAAPISTNYKYASPGGGGGFYGGGSSGTNRSDSTDYRTYTGGGSGYVYTSSTASNYPSGNLLTSTYYLTNAATNAGNTSFTNPAGVTETGHSGNGYAKITGSGTKIEVSYTIPNLMGLSDLEINLGTSKNLTDDVTLKCENNATTGCSIESVSITDTSTLSEGSHIVTYTVVGSNGRKYLFNRNISVVSKNAEQTLKNLGLTESSGTPDFSKTSCSSGCGEATVGIFKTIDDFGDSYYFRGDVANNYVYFAGFYWRIIRINGDGSVRIIYDGTSAHTNGEASTNRQIFTGAYNSTYNDNTYVGYMYGTKGASTYDATHTNKYDSTIKSSIDSWYDINIKNTDYEQYVVDTIYCNDREAYNGTGIGTEQTFYKAYNRLYINSNPTLKCNQVNDRFTVNKNIGSLEGNGALTNPVGLITADEVVYAGGTYTSGNSKFYLYTNNIFWTMSPYRFSGSNVLELSINATGNLAYLNSNNSYGIRPVVSLSGSSFVGGVGTKINPFRVSNNIQ